MIITSMRSSSYNAFSFCEQRYLIEYVLGIPSDSGKAAQKGSIVHKALELLACKKLAMQNGQSEFTDEESGLKFETGLLDPETSIQVAWDHYTKPEMTTHKWLPREFNECKKWMFAAMELGNGAFNPLNKTVIWPEKYFDFEVKKPWAEYDYKVDGKTIAGYLRLKGTIDLVCEVEEEPGSIELIDWKTGKRKDWATDKVKEWKDLRHDSQLRLYHYALRMLCPEAKQIVITIVYINDGGAFTLDFDDNDLEITERMLQKRFEVIKRNNRPKLIAPHWKCSRLCHYGKNNWQDTEKTICKYIQQETVKLGMDRVTEKHGDLGKLGAYSGGGRTSRGQ